MLTYAKRGWFVPCIASVPSWSLARDDRNPWFSRGVQCPHRPGQATSLWHHWKNRQELHRSLQHVWGPCLRKPEMSRNWFHAFCAFFCLFALMRLSPFSPACTKLRELCPNNHRLWAIPKCLWHALKLFRTNLGWSMAGGKPYSRRG